MRQIAYLCAQAGQDCTCAALICAWAQAMSLAHPLVAVMALRAGKFSGIPFSCSSPSECLVAQPHCCAGRCVCDRGCSVEDTADCTERGLCDDPNDVPRFCSGGDQGTGSASTNGSTSCMPCPAGKHASQPGSAGCDVCPAGKCPHTWGSLSSSISMRVVRSCVHCRLICTHLAVTRVQRDASDRMPVCRGRSGLHMCSADLRVGASHVAHPPCRCHGPACRQILGSSINTLCVVFAGQVLYEIRVNKLCGL